MTPQSKRRLFTEREDVLLLTQVMAEIPHLARRGTIMDVWESVARNLGALGEFDRPLFDGKKAQARFAILLRDHRDHNQHAQRASGAAEDQTERSILLDDLLAQVDDAKNDELQRSALNDEAACRAEDSATKVRDEAMKSQGKRKMRESDDDASSAGGGKMLKVLAMMNEGNKSEMELRKFMFEKDMEERRKDREVQTQQLQMLQTTMTTLLSALVNKL
ncbi:hypothetical protein DYB32_005951 [Aphanomyces invadans]|uniref:Myb-like domain-containing protein n=1 Tax=Aphanomyces invadans TaxID=157072 RepID=A0A3R7CYV4_9STRA|nr:hypothetical protein DYB32_005951 [Aphanomyces invadans]